jgi:GNAT superfamily N-acetyltransferase
MRLVVGCDLGGFNRYYKKLAMDVEWQETYGYSEELGIIWERILIKNPSQLIVWRENNEIIGHVIWHESNTEEHRKGDPRDKEDKEILERLLGEKKSFVELHEIWLTKEHRGKGYGKQFFEFFEEFIKHRGYDSIVYYANHPAAIAICRQRGYEEDYWRGKAWYVFNFSLKKNT